MHEHLYWERVHFQQHANEAVLTLLWIRLLDIDQTGEQYAAGT